jgi:hypothetical protein
MTRLLLACSLVVAFASSALVAQNSAVAHPSTTVNLKDSALLRAEGKSIKVNGVTVRNSTAIFPEDRIETGADTTAYITLLGRILMLDRNSVAVYRNSSLVPFQGRAWSSDGISAGSVKKLRLEASQLGSDVFSSSAEDHHNGDHFSGVCAKFPTGCDQAEDACEKKHHRECICQYHSDHDKDDISPIHPDEDDFKCHPINDEHD